MQALHRVFSRAARTNVEEMEEIYTERAGGPEVLKVRTVNKPIVKVDQVLIKVAATVVNRFDLIRRTSGESRFGIECSGEVVAVGEMVTRWRPKDKVCALLPAGGGYAEFVAVSAYLVMPAPIGIPLEHAAALPCAGALLWHSLFVMNILRSGQTVLIHGAAGGVGSLAIQFLKQIACRVFITAGTEEKLQFCKGLGADVCINHKRDDFEEHLTSVLGGEGVDFVLDCIGGMHFHINLNHLARGGKLIVIGLKKEGTVMMDTSIVGLQGLEVMGADIRSIGLNAMNHLLKCLEVYIWPRIAGSRVRPQIFASFRFSEAAAAHRMMEENNHMGKILLIPNRTSLE